MKKQTGRKRPADIDRGVTLDVRGDELIARITQRIRWHRKKADTVDAQLKKLLASTREPSHGNDWRRESALADLGRKLREHEERSAFLAFVRDHLARRTVYRLSGSDLHMMEIMPASVHWF